MESSQLPQQDVAEAIHDLADIMNDFASRTEGHFDKIDHQFEKVDHQFKKIDARFDKIEGRMDKVENRLNQIGSSVVTKDYLDEKLADLRGDLVVLVRKEDKKVHALIDELVERDVLDNKAANRIRNLEPFTPR